MNLRLRTLFTVLTAVSALGFTLAQDAGLGEQIAGQGNGAGAAACSSCHGADGAGMTGTPFPRIAGLDATYLSNQLRAFREGTRTEPVMAVNANALTEEEIDAVAAYFSTLEPPAATGTATEEQIARGKQLAEFGNWDRYIPSCNSCHGPDGVGVGADFPPLAGQVAMYTEQQFHYWRMNLRTGDPLGMMWTVAARMTEEDITAVAAWYSTITPGTAEQGE